MRHKPSQTEVGQLRHQVPIQQDVGAEDAQRQKQGHTSTWPCRNMPMLQHDYKHVIMQWMKTWQWEIIWTQFYLISDSTNDAAGGQLVTAALRSCVVGLWPLDVSVYDRFVGRGMEKLQSCWCSFNHRDSLRPGETCTLLKHTQTHKFNIISVSVYVSVSVCVLRCVAGPPLICSPCSCRSDTLILLPHWNPADPRCWGVWTWTTGSSSKF